MDQNDAGKSSTGMQPNVAGLLCYLLGFVTGIVFLIIEKENKFVRFHAMQSIIVFGGLFVLNIILTFILTFIPFIGWLLGLLLSILGLILWILLMIKAYNGEMYKLPVVGDMAEQKSQQL